MSRRPRKKKANKSKPKRESPAPARPYWTLLIWLLLIGGLLAYQTRRLAGQEHQRVEGELQTMETQYEDRLAELELQITLLESQLDTSSDRQETE